MLFFRNMVMALATVTVLTLPALAAGGLTIKQITENGSLSGSVPSGLKFSPDGARVTFLRSSPENSRVLDLW